MRIQHALLAALLLAAPACMADPAAGTTPMRSPTLDYPLPPQETSDGHIVGADRIPPEDKLRMGPRIGSEGVKPSESPGYVEKVRPEPVQTLEDPMCKTLAINDAARSTRCRGTPEAVPPR